MLQDLDILEDWTAIRKVDRQSCTAPRGRLFCRGLSFSVVSPQAMASLGPHRVKVDGKSFLLVLGYSQYLAECGIDSQPHRKGSIRLF